MKRFFFIVYIFPLRPESFAASFPMRMIFQTVSESKSERITVSPFLLDSNRNNNNKLLLIINNIIYTYIEWYNK